MVRWTAMLPQDLPDILALADILHPDYPEDLTIFADKLQFCPQACRIARNADGRLIGYAFAHPWFLGRPPHLNAVLPPPDRPADCLHLHDIALSPDHRGLGGPSEYLRDLNALAARMELPMLSLVAVRGQREYWAAKGFEIAAVNADDLAAYGDGVTYMTKPTEAR